MNRFKWLLVMTLWVPGPLTAAEYIIPVSGVELLSHCRVYSQLAPMPWGFKVMETNPSVSTCLDFMNGIIKKSTGSGESNPYCLPEEINSGQLAAIFVTFADMYPQHLDQDAVSAVAAVLGEAYPCR